jgi:hypothetical protein
MAEYLLLLVLKEHPAARFQRLSLAGSQQKTEHCRIKQIEVDSAAWRPIRIGQGRAVEVRPQRKHRHLIRRVIATITLRRCHAELGLGRLARRRRA